MRAAGWVKEVATAESMRHWRRARVLAREAGKSPEADALAAEALTGILQLAWRLGMTPEETAAIRDQVDAGAEQVRTDPHYAGFLFHSGQELEGLEAFRDVSREAIVAADPGRILTAATGVAFASWIAGTLGEGVEALERAMPLADGDPTLGSGLAFISPLGHAHGSLGLCLGYMGELEAAREHFERGAELTREHNDPANLSHNRGNLAMLEADAGDLDAAIALAAEGLAISERMDDAIGVIACSTAAASAQADSGRPAEALAVARSNLETIRRRQIGSYYEPMLLAMIARSQLALGEPEAALAAAEEGVEIMDARGLAACAMRAPITLAQVLRATQGEAAHERIEAVLSRRRSRSPWHPARWPSNPRSSVSSMPGRGSRIGWRPDASLHSVDPMEPEAIQCRVCGESGSPDAKFCPRCGARLLVAPPRLTVRARSAALALGLMVALLLVCSGAASAASGANATGKKVDGPCSSCSRARRLRRRCTGPGRTAARSPPARSGRRRPGSRRRRPTTSGSGTSPSR